MICNKADSTDLEIVAADIVDKATRHEMSQSILMQVQPLVLAVKALEKTIEIQKASVSEALQTTNLALRKSLETDKSSSTGALDKAVMDQRIRNVVASCIEGNLNLSYYLNLIYDYTFTRA